MRRWIASCAVLVLLAACGPRWPRSADIANAPRAGSSSSGQDGDVASTDLTGATPETAPGVVSQPGGATAATRTTSRPTSGSGAVPAGDRTGVTIDTINICYLVPLTGAAPVPTSWSEGATLYWEYTKRHGGINGRNVRLTVKDTKSDTAEALARARDCINEKAFAALTLDRFEVEAAVGRFLNSAGVPNVLIQAPPSASGADQTNSFVITMSHVVQGRLIADYFTSGDLKGKKYAVVRENVPDLVPGTDAFKAQLGKRGGNLVAEDAVDGQGNDFSSTVRKLSTAGAEVVWFYGAPLPFAKLAGQSQAAGYHPIWFANSISWAFDDTAELGNKTGAMAGARGFSSWVTPRSSQAAQYRQAYQEVFPGDDADDIGIVGWGVGEVLGAALRNAGRDLGRNAFRVAMQNLNVTPQTWAPLRFGEGVRIGANTILEFRINGDHWEQVGTFRESFD